VDEPASGVPGEPDGPVEPDEPQTPLVGKQLLPSVFPVPSEIGKQESPDGQSESDWQAVPQPGLPLLSCRQKFPLPPQSESCWQVAQTVLEDPPPQTPLVGKQSFPTVLPFESWIG
jgi:hypothetical protein